MNCEWSELKRHVVTRCLSLFPTIENILKNWEPINSYFLSLEKCPPLILKILFSDNQVTINTDLEMYFFFLSHILPLFNECINKLQGNSISAMVIYDVMKSLKNL